MSGLFSRRLVDKVSSNVFSDPADSEGDSTSRKRVEFHPWTTNILEPQLSTPDSEIPTSLKSLPPSRDCQLTVRPILKQSLSAPTIIGLDGHTEKLSPLDNMDSLLRNLAINERPSSVDAYQTMTNLIRTYDEPPEQDVLQRKIAQLQKYIKRDLVVLDAGADNLPSEDRLGMGSLIMSALKVLVTVVWSPVYSPCLTDDFRTWTIERTIRVLKEHVAPKAVLLHYMHLLATQNFRGSFLTQNDRVIRILEALQELTDYVSGKAVVAERLLVYQKLIQQAKQIMKARPEMWIKNVITAMGHSFKEVRSNAVSAGTEACTAYAGVSTVSGAARDALAEVSNDRTLSVSIANRLERVLAAKDEANQIPQIWTLVLLLCNSGQQKLDSWLQLHDWLKLIQRCFNSSDMTVRVQAFLAWNRLYFIARPHEASDKVLSMLAKPAMVQLDRTGNNQPSKGTRQAVISSYCMLLYYAFRPSASSAQYTRMWNEFVVKLMTRSFLSKSSSNCDLSCRILAALFHSSLSKTRVWNENRAHENAALDPLELPAIDCKWIRSKSAAVLSIFRLIVDYSSFGPSGSISEQAYAPQAWRNLMQAIKESTNKEIKPSADTKAALNSLVDFLRPFANEDDDTEIENLVERTRRLALLSRITVEVLGTSNIMQALENSTFPINSVLLHALAHHLSRPDGDPTTQSLLREKFTDRCIHLLSTELEFITQANSGCKESFKSIILEQAGDSLTRLATNHARQCLLNLRKPITSILEDANKQFANNHGPSSGATPYQKFCDSIISLIEQCGNEDHEVMEAFVTAAVSSSHAWIRDIGFQWVNKSDSPDKGGLKEADPQPMAKVGSIATRSTSISNDEVIRSDQRVKQISGRRQASSGAIPVPGKSRKTRGKLRHEDSQVDFVPVESSPREYTFESQFLTMNQKEVRERQIAEPAVTFADIRSSPMTVKKRTIVTEDQAVQSGTPELPGTPTLPMLHGREEEEQPPTPTPKARKSKRLNLQPEVTSSPPSVNGEGRENPSLYITSSPVKDVAERDDAISFEEADEDFSRDERDNNLLSPTNPEKLTPATEQNISIQQTSTDAMSDNNIDQAGSTTEEYETAEIDKSSPAAFSDEFDALAASQLSQALAEESSFMTSRLDDEGTPRPQKTTRKRKGGERETPSSRKRLRSSTAEDDVLQTEVIEAIGGDTTEQTIYVKVESTTPSTSRVTRARAAQESLDQSLASQKTSASNTPSSRRSKGSRKRGRPRKKRSQSSQQSSPVTQDIDPASGIDVPDPDSCVTDAIVYESSENKRPTSLGSEVFETIRSEEQQMLLQQTASAEELLHSSIPRAATPGAEPENGPSSPSITGLEHPSAETNFDIIANLESVLETLNHPNADHRHVADLAAIHSLCFQIGLKAQELASR